MRAAQRDGRLLGALLLIAAAAAGAQQRAIPLAESRSGASFAGSDLRAQQADDFSNPGMLWVERGAKLWNSAPAAGAPSCAACHGDATTSMKGVATRHPAFDPKSKKLLNLEGRINQCRAANQKASSFAPESEDLLAMTAFVAHQSRGLAFEVAIDGPAQPHFERGREFYYRRVGQMNLSCAQCHEQNWGRRLLTETISQGQPNAYPIYRLEWQTAGSLHRRLRSCLSGVRAELPPVGAPEFVDLELFLAWRAQGLKIETPGVRR